jgi:LPXTG-site transpeptidase (sortase) family protein
MADTALAGPGPTPAAGAGGQAGPGTPPGNKAPAPASTTEPGSPNPVLQGAGVALLLLAVVVLGFIGYLYFLSGVQQARSQSVLYQKLQIQLGQVGGVVAPLGPTTAGAPIAILNIPSIGIHDMVVVEGTSSENLMLGPGHLRTTPYPGQAGVSEIFGRRATFGGPFKRLEELRPGALIETITGQGKATYTVAAVANSKVSILDQYSNRLLLYTASSPVVPSYYVEIDAHLTTAPKASPGVVHEINAQELVLAGDGGALVLSWTWALALILVSAAGTIAVTRWSPWAAYLVVVPVALAVLWNLYQNLAALLPNLY